MNKAKQDELKTLICAAMKKQQSYAATFKGHSNPQVIETYIRCQAQAETLEFVLNAFNGNLVELRILGEAD